VERSRRLGVVTHPFLAGVGAQKGQLRATPRNWRQRIRLIGNEPGRSPGAASGQGLVPATASIPGSRQRWGLAIDGCGPTEKTARARHMHIFHSSSRPAAGVAGLRNRGADPRGGRFRCGGDGALSFSQLAGWRRCRTRSALESEAVNWGSRKTGRATDWAGRATRGAWHGWRGGQASR